MKKYVTMGIMLSLLDGKRHTAPSLASKYETSVKTIYRAIDTLLESGMPIVCTQGKGGGFELINENKLNSSFFTLDELCSFISFLKNSSTNFLKSNYNLLADRINNISNKNIKDKLFQQSPIVIDTMSWGSSDIYDEYASLIKSAIDNQNLMQITYLSDNIESQRQIQPYALVYKAGFWYVYAYCKKRASFRLFKLNRITSLKTLEITFEKQNIDINSKPWNKDFSNNLEQITLELKCSKNTAVDIKDWLQSSKLINNPSAKDKQVHLKGNAIFSIGLVHRLMQYGDSVQVIKPNKLKEALINECQNISCVYNEKNAFCNNFDAKCV